MNDPFFYDQWQNHTLSYDLKRYNFPKLVLELIQELYPKTSSLDQIHNFVPSKNIVTIYEHVQKSFSRKKFMILFDEFAQEYLAPKVNGKKYLIKRLPTLNCVIPNQAKLIKRLPFHQGIFYSNGRGMATQWMPLTKTFGTNSMYIANLEDSRKLTRKVIKDKLNLQDFEKECLKICTPVEKEPGEVHLFTQEHIHGNVNNETNVTRCALDWHILIEDEEYGWRAPGGFFRMPGDYQQSVYEDYSEKKFITYFGNNTDYDKNIPGHFQILMMEKYCKDKSIHHNGIIVENEGLHWLPILEHYIEQKTNIIMCSIKSLPDNKERRRELLDKALCNNVQIHFANEYCRLKDKKDLEKINIYADFGYMQKGEKWWKA